MLRKVVAERLSLRHRLNDRETSVKNLVRGEGDLKVVLSIEPKEESTQST
jgi:hypothetical protein